MATYFPFPPTSVMSPASVLLANGAQNLNADFWISAILSRPLLEGAATIQKIEHYKCVKQPEHEFLALHAQSASHKTVFVAERSVQPLAAQTPSAALSYSSAVSSPSSALTSVPADDVVSVSPPNASHPLLFITQNHGAYRLLRTLQFPAANSPFDTHLAMLLQLVKEHSPSYDIRHQCFWYAGTIFDVFHTVYAAHERREPNHFHLMGTYLGVAIPGLRHLLPDIVRRFRSILGSIPGLISNLDPAIFPYDGAGWSDNLDSRVVLEGSGVASYASDEETLAGDYECKASKQMREVAHEMRHNFRHHLYDELRGHGPGLKSLRQEGSQALHSTASVVKATVKHVIHPANLEHIHQSALRRIPKGQYSY